MCGSKVMPFEKPVPKACSGKCMGSCSSRAPRVWVVAACSGMIAIFEKRGDSLARKYAGGFASLEAFLSAIRAAAENEEFDQLMVVGSPQDVAWVEAALPEAASQRIVAEMQYPLLPAWFTAPEALTSALSQVLRS